MVYAHWDFGSRLGLFWARGVQVRNARCVSCWSQVPPFTLCRERHRRLRRLVCKHSSISHTHRSQHARNDASAPFRYYCTHSRFCPSFRPSDMFWSRLITGAAGDAKKYPLRFKRKKRQVPVSTPCISLYQANTDDVSPGASISLILPHYQPHNVY